MLSLKKLFGENAATKQGALLYRSIAMAARSPSLYVKYEVPDTFDGRFDALLLLQSLVSHLLLLKEQGGTVRQMQEMLIRDMDRALREMGVGDLSVGKQVKKMGAALIGRQNSYHEALEAENGLAILELALIRNLYRDGEGAETKAKKLAPVIFDTYAKWSQKDMDEMRIELSLVEDENDEKN